MDFGYVDKRKQLKSAGAPDWAARNGVSRIKSKTSNVSPETHIRPMKGEPTPPSDVPEDVDPHDWASILGKKR